jgi:hypothetical protein
MKAPYGKCRRGIICKTYRILHKGLLLRPEPMQLQFAAGDMGLSSAKPPSTNVSRGLSVQTYECSVKPPRANSKHPKLSVNR